MVLLLATSLFCSEYERSAITCFYRLASSTQHTRSCFPRMHSVCLTGTGQSVQRRSVPDDRIVQAPDERKIWSDAPGTERRVLGAIRRFPLVALANHGILATCLLLACWGSCLARARVPPGVRGAPVPHHHPVLTRSSFFSFDISAPYQYLARHGRAIAFPDPR